MLPWRERRKLSPPDAAGPSAKQIDSIADLADHPNCTTHHPRPRRSTASACTLAPRTIDLLSLARAQKYKDHGLVVIGTHLPEFAFEKDEANVRRAIHDLGITYPVAMDNALKIWQAFNNDISRPIISSMPRAAFAGTNPANAITIIPHPYRLH
jgi:hypothetical protein